MTHSRGEEAEFPIPQAGGREICHSRMKIVETSHCGVSMFFSAVGWTAAASAGQDPLSLPGSCLPGNCRRSPTYGYGRLRLSDAGEGCHAVAAAFCVAGVQGRRDAGVLVLADLLWLLCPFGVGSQLNELCGAAGVRARCGTSAEETKK